MVALKYPKQSKNIHTFIYIRPPPRRAPRRRGAAPARHAAEAELKGQT